MSDINKQQGFTLIEILLAITISVILFMILASSYDLSQKIYNQTDTKAEITQNGRVILDRLIREFRQTPDIVTQLGESYTDASHEIIFQDGHDISIINYIRYFLDGNNLDRQDVYYFFPEDPSTHVLWNAKNQDGSFPQLTSSTPRVIGEYVDDIEFWGKRLININLYLSKSSGSEILNTAVYGRNL